MGRIADRGAEHVSAREWMRICFELLELLKAHKKAIRRAAVNTFGYIAKAIGYFCVIFNILTRQHATIVLKVVCTIQFTSDVWNVVRLINKSSPSLALVNCQYTLPVNRLPGVNWS